MPNLSDYNPAIKYGANLDVNVDLADIRDANDNELLELDTVASAVNYIRIANAAAGSDPELSVQGDDTNADMQLSALGTGSILLGTRSTGTEASGSVTINAIRGIITTSSLTTASTTVTNFDFVNNRIVANSVLLLTITGGGNSGGRPFIAQCNRGTGSATIQIGNAGVAALNGTVVIDFIVL